MKKTLALRSKDNKHNVGSVSIEGKTSPKANPRSSLSKKGSKLADSNLPKVVIKVPGDIFTHEEFNLIQEREDYLNLFSEMGYILAEDMEFDSNLKDLFIQRVRSYAKSSAGQRELEKNLERLIKENPRSERDYRIVAISHVLKSKRK